MRISLKRRATPISDRSSSELDSHSQSRIHPHFVKPRVYYRVHKSPPFVHNMSQMNPVHNFPTNFPKINANIIFPSTPRSSGGLFPSGIPTKILYAFLVSLMPVTCNAYLIFVDLITLIIFDEKYKFQSSSL
jgi:hypothetical protein